MTTDERLKIPPEITDDGNVRHFGVGPECPGCGGPTHCVTAREGAERPWWCQHCNVRLDDNGDYGAQATFPAGSKPLESA